MATREEKIRRLKELRLKQLRAKAKGRRSPQDGLVDAPGAPAGPFEAGASVASSVAAEPIAGMAGLAKSITSGSEAGEQTLNQFREALTFQPRTRQGQEALQGFGEAVKPVGEAIQGTEQALGDFVFNVTESPELAAGATTLPTAVLELLGFKASGLRRALTRDPNKPRKVTDKEIKKFTQDAALGVDELFEAADPIFKQIDDMGVTIKRRPASTMVDKIKKAFKSKGGGEKSTPRSFGIVEDIDDLLGPESTQVGPQATLIKSRAGGDVSLETLNGFRDQLNALAKTTDKSEAAAARSMVDAIDSFLESVGEDALKIPEGVGPKQAARIGETYKFARGLWRQARNGEQFLKIVEDARNANNFDTAFRGGLRSWLKNEKKSKFLNADEKKAIQAMLRPEKPQRMLEFAARFGFDRNRMLTPMIGLSGGMAAGGAKGVLVPTVGSAASALASRMLEKQSKFADAVIRAGKNHEKIVRAYLENTPKGKRNIDELGLLLAGEGVDPTKLKNKTPFIEQSVDKALQFKQDLARAGATGVGVQGISQLDTEGRQMEPEQTQESARTPFSGLAQSFGGR